jgi:hypothetical protein
MAVRREETLQDLLPELSRTMSELSTTKEEARVEKRRARQDAILQDRRDRARGSANWRVGHEVGWIDAGKLSSAAGGGGGAEFGPYIRPTPCMLSPMEQVRAMAPDRVYERGIRPGWIDPSRHSFAFNPRVNEDELCKPLPERFSYLRPKLTASRPKPPLPPPPRFPKWVDPTSVGGLFEKMSSLAPTALTPNQAAAMVAPARNFDETVSNITGECSSHCAPTAVSHHVLNLRRVLFSHEASCTHRPPHPSLVARLR